MQTIAMLESRLSTSSAEACPATLACPVDALPVAQKIDQEKDRMKLMLMQRVKVLEDLAGEFEKTLHDSQERCLMMGSGPRVLPLTFLVLNRSLLP